MNEGRRWKGPLAGLLLAVLVGLAGLGAWAFADGRSRDPTTLGGARRFASGGDAPVQELRDGDAPLDEVELEWASLLTASADGGLLLLVEPPGGDYRVEASASGKINAVGLVGLDGVFPDSQTAVGVGPDGSTAIGRSDTQGLNLWVRDRHWTGDELPLRFVAGAVAFRDDGAVLVGGGHESRIDAVAADGTTTGLLGPAGSDARVILGEPIGRIVSLVGLADGRVVFVADTVAGYELFLLDETEVRPLVDDAAANPVKSTGERPTDPSVRPDRLAMTPLAPAPGGRVLATGIGESGDPEISVVDVDSGEVEVLAVLEGVEATVERPVSAVAVGDDLVFLAEHKLWKLEAAFGTG